MSKRGTTILLTAVTACIATCLFSLLVSAFLLFSNTVLYVATAAFPALWNIVSHEAITSTLPLDSAWIFRATGSIDEQTSFDDHGTVYVGTNSRVFALEGSSGQERWSHDTGPRAKLPIRSVPNINLVLVAARKGTVIRALDTRNGDTKWELTVADYAPVPLNFPTVTDIVVDVHQIYAIVDLHRGTQVLSIDVLTGRVLWHGNAEMINSLESPSAAFIDDDWLVVAAGKVFILDKQTGAVIYQGRVPHSPYLPVYASKTLYTGGDALHAIALPSFHEKWRFRPSCTALEDTGVWIEVTETIIYTVACGQTYALNAMSGHVLWHDNVKIGQSARSAAALNGYVYVLGSDTALRALDSNTGAEYGRLTVKPKIMTPDIGNYVKSNANILIVRWGGNTLLALRKSLTN